MQYFVYIFSQSARTVLLESPAEYVEWCRGSGLWGGEEFQVILSCISPCIYVNLSCNWKSHVSVVLICISWTEMSEYCKILAILVYLKQFIHQAIRHFSALSVIIRVLVPFSNISNISYTSLVNFLVLYVWMCVCVCVWLESHSFLYIPKCLQPAFQYFNQFWSTSGKGKIVGFLAFFQMISL